MGENSATLRNAIVSMGNYRVYGDVEELRQKLTLIVDPEYFELRLSALQERFNEFSDAVEYNLYAMKQRKYGMARRLQTVLNYSKKRYGFQYPANFLSKFLYRDHVERRLCMLKYLQSEHTEITDGKDSRTALANVFGVSKRIIDSDFAALRDGFDFMGVKMTVKNFERKTQVYSTKINPLFLSLDGGEAYALTVALKRISNGTIFEETLSKVADKIYLQLSEFTQDMISQTLQEEHFHCADTFLKSVSSADLLHRECMPIEYFLKGNAPCYIGYTDKNDKFCSGTGHLKLIPDCNDKVLFVPEDGPSAPLHPLQIRKLTNQLPESC